MVPLRGPAALVALLVSTLTLVALTLAAQTLLAWLALAGLVTLLATRGRLTWWPAVTTVLLLSVVNSLKWPESDLAEYFILLDDIRLVPLSSLLGDESALLSIRSSEPVFRTLMWLAARADPLPRIAFALVVGLFVYGSLLMLCRWATSSANTTDPTWQAAIATTIALLVGVTFSLVGHLTRQYFAGGLFFLGLFGWAFTGHYRWWLGPAVACATHNSALLLIVPLTLSAFLSSRPRLFVMVVLATLGASLAGLFPLIDELAEATSFLKEDGQIGIALPLMDAALLLVAWYVWRCLPVGDRPAMQIALRLMCFSVALAVMLFCIREVPLLYFRSYFYIEFLRAPMLAFVIAAVLRGAGNAAALNTVVALPLAALLCWLRVRGTDWNYSSEHSYWPEWLDVHSVLMRWQAIQAAVL